MTILIGILLYSICVLFFCALTRANPRDEADNPVAPKLVVPHRAEERYEPVPTRGAVQAREARL